MTCHNAALTVLVSALAGHARSCQRQAVCRHSPLDFSRVRPVSRPMIKLVRSALM